MFVVMSAANSVVERVNANTSCYRWKIRDFDEIDKVVDLILVGPRMTATNSRVDWCLLLFPNGTTEKSNDCVTVAVEYFTDTDDIVANFELSIVNNNSEIIEDYKMIREIRLKSNQVAGNASFSPRAISMEHISFPVRRTDIENPRNRLLANNCFTLSFDVTYQDPMVVLPIPRENKTFKSAIDYGKLLESGDLNDVTFNVGDKQIRAHKVILAMRSSVFHTMFTTEMQENKQNVVDIVDINYEVMMELFRFMYTGTVSDIQKVACDLLVAAEKYCVEELKILCERTMLDNLKIGNVVACLAAADACNAKQLKERAFKFIVNNVHKVMDREEFTSLNSTLMRDIMRATVPKRHK